MAGPGQRTGQSTAGVPGLSPGPLFGIGEHPQLFPPTHVGKREAEGPRPPLPGPPRRCRQGPHAWGRPTEASPHLDQQNWASIGLETAPVVPERRGAPSCPPCPAAPRGGRAAGPWPPPAAPPARGGTRSSGRASAPAEQPAPAALPRSARPCSVLKTEGRKGEELLETTRCSPGCRDPGTPSLRAQAGGVGDAGDRRGPCQGPYPRARSGQAGCRSCWQSCRTLSAPSSLSLSSRQVSRGVFGSRAARAPISQQLPSLRDRSKQGLTLARGAAPGGKQGTPTPYRSVRSRQARRWSPSHSSCTPASCSPSLKDGSSSSRHGLVPSTAARSTAGTGEAGVPQPAEELRERPSGPAPGPPGATPPW